MKDNKKSKVKASGLKSVIHLGNAEIVMANFTDSPIELKITNGAKPERVATKIQSFNATADNDYKITSCRTPPA